MAVNSYEQISGVESAYNPGTGTWEVIVKYNGDLGKIESELGAEIERLGSGIAIVTLKDEQISDLLGYREIEYIELPKNLALMQDQNLRISCISPVQHMQGGGLTGKGTLIGIMDSGIDYTHPDFRNSDGTSRIQYIWDQTENGRPPSGFKQGTEYTNEDINRALGSKQPFNTVKTLDLIGHGTAVAGIAAGNGRGGESRETGVAPEASLIVVKLGYRGFESFARTTEIMRAVKYIQDKAEAIGAPVAVNISYGTNHGSHDGSSLFETYIDDASQQWKTAIIVASGNEGAAGHHFAAKISKGQTIDVDFAVAENLDTFYLTCWKNFVDQFSWELFLPGGKSTGLLNPAQFMTAMNIEGASLEIYYGQPTYYNEDQEIFFRMKGLNGSLPQGIWRIRVKGLEVVEGKFDMWLPTVEEVGQNTVFTKPTADLTLTLPSTASNVITVGGYNGEISAAAPFSGRGFTRNHVYVKPDLVAPATGIISTRAGGGYDSFTGTSLAAPFVTGSSALMMQWGIVQGNDPFLYGQRIKAFLKRGARRNQFLKYPNTIWGYGELCLKSSMDALKNGG